MGKAQLKGQSQAEEPKSLYEGQSRTKYPKEINKTKKDHDGNGQSGQQ